MFWAALAASALLHAVGLAVWALLSPGRALPGCVLGEQRMQMVRLVTESCICPDPANPRPDCPTLTHAERLDKPVITKPMRATQTAVDESQPKNGAGGDVESAGGYRVLTAEGDGDRPGIPSGGGGAGVGTGTGTGVSPGVQEGETGGIDRQTGPPSDKGASKPPVEDVKRPLKDPGEVKPPTVTKETPTSSEPTPSEDTLAKYRALVAAKLEASKRYPALSQQRGEDGVVLVSFAVELDGMPSNVRIERSSGIRRLDAEARDTVSRAAPFLPLPKGARQPIPISARLTFSIR